MPVTNRPRAGRRTSIADDDLVGTGTSVTRTTATRWLLKMLRLYAPEAELKTVRGLAAAMRCATVPNASYATISRWEQTATPLSRAALARYEQLFGLGRGQLTAVVSTVRQAPPVHNSVPAAAALHERGPGLLERCLSDDQITGADWLDIADFLTMSGPESGPVWLREQNWLEIITRLLIEMSLSCGWRYLQRMGALHRLHYHQQGRGHLVQAVIHFVSDPNCHIVVDPVAILSDSPERSTQQVLVKMLLSPGSEPILRAAIIALTHQAARRIVDPVTAQRIIPRAISHVVDTGDSRPVRCAAADLLAVLSRTHPIGALDKLRAHPGIDDELRAALSLRTTTPRVALPAQVSELLHSLSRTADGRHDEDTVVVRLVQDAMFSTDIDSKIYAANYLQTSPFRRVVANTAAELLHRSADGHVSPADAALADLIGNVGEAENRPVLERALRIGDRDLAIAATFGLAHLPGHTSLTTWRNVLSTHRDGTGPDKTLCGAVLYAAGMNQDEPALRFLAKHADMPTEIRRRAHWWLHLPAAQVRCARL